MKIKDWLAYLKTLDEEKELLLYDNNYDSNLEDSKMLDMNRIRENANGDYVII